MGSLLPQVSAIIQENDELRRKLKAFSGSDNLMQSENAKLLRDIEKLKARIRELEPYKSLADECEVCLLANGHSETEMNTVPKLIETVRNEFARLRELEALNAKLRAQIAAMEAAGADSEAAMLALRNKLADLEAQLADLERSKRLYELLSQRVKELNDKFAATYATVENDMAMRMLDRVNQLEFTVTCRCVYVCVCACMCVCV